MYSGYLVCTWSVPGWTKMVAGGSPSPVQDEKQATFLSAINTWHSAINWDNTSVKTSQTLQSLGFELNGSTTRNMMFE